jgi:hypothetical protein
MPIRGAGGRASYEYFVLRLEYRTGVPRTEEAVFRAHDAGFGTDDSRPGRAARLAAGFPRSSSSHGRNRPALKITPARCTHLSKTTYTVQLVTETCLAAR